MRKHRRSTVITGAVLGTVLMTMTATVSAGAVYRSVDANGNPVFSDQPMPDNKRIEVAPPTVVDVKAEPRPGAAPLRGAPVASDAFVTYTRLAITSPNDEATIPPGAAGDVQVELAIAPDLAPDHKVRLLVDGQVSQSALRTTAFMIPGMVRGEHHLRAEVVDSAGHVLQQSDSITIYVHRASQNMPANPHSSPSRP